MSRLLAQVRHHCEQDGTPWRLFDEAAAVDFLRDEFGERLVAAFRKCVHQAQRSDLFRYFYLVRRGGLWLDADLALVRPPSPLLRPRTPVLFQRRQLHGLLTNCLIAAERNDPVIVEIAKTALRNIEDDAVFAPLAARRDIYMISGPAVVSLVVARRLHQALKEGCATPPVTIIDESVHDRFLLNGWVALGEPLNYMSTERSWQRWKEKAPQ